MSKWKNSAYRRRLRASLFLKQSGICAICNGEMTLGNPTAQDYATFDHLVPRGHGGPNAQVNLRLACLECNNQTWLSFS